MTMTINPYKVGFAQHLWSDVQQEMAVAIVGTIRTMGLPVTGNGATCQPKQANGRTPGHDAVRVAVLEDRDLHDEIVDRVEVEFWRAVERGGITSADDRPLVFRIIQCVTWRLTTQRASQLLRTVSSAREDDITEGLASEDPLPEEAMAMAEIRDRLQRVLTDLSDLDRRLLLEGKAGEGYGELADELGVDVGTLRVRAHRLWKRVKAEVLGVEVTT